MIERLISLQATINYEWARSVEAPNFLKALIKFEIFSLLICSVKFDHALDVQCNAEIKIAKEQY